MDGFGKYIYFPSQISSRKDVLKFWLLNYFHSDISFYNTLNICYDCIKVSKLLIN